MKFQLITLVLSALIARKRLRREDGPDADDSACRAQCTTDHGVVEPDFPDCILVCL